MEGWRELAGDLDWKDWLTTRDDAAVVALLRLNTRTGPPLATDTFLSKLPNWKLS